MAGGRIYNRPRIVVIVHKLLIRRGELRDEIVQHAQRLVQQVKFRLHVAGGGLVLRKGFARLGDEQVVGGDGGLQQIQLGGGRAVIGERCQVRVGGVVNFLATAGGFRVASGHQIAQRIIHLVGQRVVFGLGGISVEGTGKRQGGVAHGLPRLFFVRRDAAGVLRLRLPEMLDVGDVRLQVGIAAGKGRDGGDDDGVGIANPFQSQRGR